MVVEQVNFQLLIPHSLIKACSQLVGEAQFEVGGFYLEGKYSKIQISD